MTRKDKPKRMQDLHALLLRGVKKKKESFMLKKRKEARAVGRKPKFESVEQMQALIDAYFETCEGELLRSTDGNPVLTKDGSPVYIGRRPPTIPGLALALGFSSRQSLYNYKAKKEFLDTIARAQTRVEQYTAEKLFERDSQRGAQFALEYGFRYRQEAEQAQKEGTQTRVLLELEAEEAAE